MPSIERQLQGMHFATRFRRAVVESVPNCLLLKLARNADSLGIVLHEIDAVAAAPNAGQNMCSIGLPT